MKITVVLKREFSGNDVSERIKNHLQQLTGKQCYVIIRKDSSRINNLIKSNR